MNTPAVAPMPIHITLAQAPTPTPAWYLGPAALPFITLVVAIITIVFGFKKTKMELTAAATEAKTERDLSVEQARLNRQHAADEAHQERITSARREVYLELIGEMTKAQASITALPMQGLDKIDPQAGLGGLLVAASKIGLLGEMRTVVLSRELIVLINQMLVNAMQRVLPLEEQRELGKKHELLGVKWTAEIDQLSGLATDFSSRKVWSSESARVNNQLRTAHGNRVESAEKVALARSTFNSLYQNYSLALFNESKIIGDKVDELINSMRDELNLTTSLEELRGARIAMQTAAEISLTGLHNTLNQMINESKTDEPRSDTTS